MIRIMNILIVKVIKIKYEKVSTRNLDRSGKQHETYYVVTCSGK